MTKLQCNCSGLDHLENEILKAESALSELDAELISEQPSYANSRRYRRKCLRVPSVSERLCVG